MTGRDRYPAFVADGQQRLRQTSGYKQAVADIEREVHAQFAERLKRVGPISRFVLFFCRRREVARRVSKLAPTETLYVSSAP